MFRIQQNRDEKLGDSIVPMVESDCLFEDKAVIDTNNRLLRKKKKSEMTQEELAEKLQSERVKRLKVIDDLVIERAQSQEIADLIKRALEGQAIALCALGLRYAKGSGVIKDEPTAVQLFLKAALQQNITAEYNLGVCYHIGIGGIKDQEMAIQWYSKAAEQGHTNAQFYLGLLLSLAKDEQGSARSFQKAAIQGHTKAQLKIAWCYAYGKGVPRDVPAAALWLKKAAEEGDHARAQKYLGLFYAHGIGVTKNENEAVRWFRKAAEKKYAPPFLQKGNLILKA